MREQAAVIITAAGSSFLLLPAPLAPLVPPLAFLGAADGSARAVFRNVTFNCISQAKGGGGQGGVVALARTSI